MILRSIYQWLQSVNETTLGVLKSGKIEDFCRFHLVQHRAQLESLTQGKLLPCSPPIKKTRSNDLAFLLEVERRIQNF